MEKEIILDYMNKGLFLMFFDEKQKRIYFVRNYLMSNSVKTEISYIDKSDNRKDGYYLTAGNVKLSDVNFESLELFAVCGLHNEPRFRFANYNKDRLYEIVNMFDQEYHRDRVLYYLGLSGFAECSLDHLGDDYSHTSNPVEDVYYYPADEEFWSLVKQYIYLPFDTLKRKEVNYNNCSLD